MSVKNKHADMESSALNLIDVMLQYHANIGRPVNHDNEIERILLSMSADG